jgi:hypothetical protein
MNRLMMANVKYLKEEDVQQEREEDHGQTGLCCRKEGGGSVTVRTLTSLSSREQEWHLDETMMNRLFPFRSIRPVEKEIYGSHGCWDKQPNSR